MRIAGLIVFVAAAVDVPWLVVSLNWDQPWLAVPFLAANVFTVVVALLSVVNSWSRSVPVARSVAPDREPHVAVIVPTCGEPVPMILRTLEIRVRAGLAA